MTTHYTTEGGLHFYSELIDGETPLVKVTIEDRDEFPIYVTASSDQMLCVIYLFDEAQIIADKIHEMNEAMLRLSLPMPLSSFAKVGNQYVVFGALSSDSQDSVILYELETLSDNALDAIEALEQFLKSE